MKPQSLTESFKDFFKDFSRGFSLFGNSGIDERRDYGKYDEFLAEKALK
jgi:hypothetical protein